jgi:tetratricopeptide (TPR) repeat protein
MMTVWLLVVMLGVATAQPATITQTTEGWCSPAVGHTQGDLTIVCQGVDPKALQRLNKLLDKQELELQEKIREAEEWTRKYVEHAADLVQLRRQNQELTQRLRQIQAVIGNDPRAAGLTAAADRALAEADRALAEADRVLAEGDLESARGLVAWSAFQQGTALYEQYTKEANAQARTLFEKAISLDPLFARAYASLAATYRQDWYGRWSQVPRISERLAFDLAQRSVALDPSGPYGHQQLAYLYVYRGQYDQAIAEAKRAVTLDPNGADGYAALAQMLTYAGRPQEALGLMEEAMRLTPEPPAYYFYHLGLAYYVMKQYDKALANLQKAINISPTYQPALEYLVAVYSEMGREEEAREVSSRLLGMGHPQGLENRRRLAPYKDSAITERYLAAWQKVGEGETHSPRQGLP